MSVKLGFIGAGNINRNHLQSGKDLGLDLVAIADKNVAAAQDAANIFSVSKTYDDPKQLLGDTNIDAVVIGTPNKFHAEQAIAALQAGKHVFLEKPMAMNVAESDAILAARDKSGKLLQMGMVNRFKAGTQALKKYIDAGRCGKIYTGQAYVYRRRGIPGFGGWFTTKSLSGGGVLIDLGVHVLDLSLYLMNFPKPVSVSGATYNTWQNLADYTYVDMWGKPTPGGKKDVEDYALATVRFADGQTLQINVSWALNIEPIDTTFGLRLMGDRGGVELKDLEHPHAYAEEAGHLSDVKLHCTANNPMKEEMRHFAECVGEGRPPMASGEQGRVVQSIIDAIYRSSEERREVSVA